MALATLTIDLVAKLGNIEQDLGRLNHLVDQTAGRMSSSFSSAKRAAEAKAKWEAEQAEKKRLAEVHNVYIEPEPEPQLPLAVAEPVKVAFGGATASKIAPRKIPPAAVIGDWAAAAAHYSGSPKLQEIIQKLANADAKNGVAAPGVTIVKGE